MVKHTALVILVAVACATPHPIAAQSMSGALIGTLTDTDGGVLTGAVVRISSPSLIGGAQMVTTDGRGQLRFPALPPGDYWLDIEVHGFKAYHEQNIRIAAGATLERSITLNVKDVAELVIVNATGSRLEARNSGFDTRFGPEDLSAIPTRRFSMFDFVRAAQVSRRPRRVADQPTASQHSARARTKTRS